jgi:ferredoxin--NADP+ reductase
MINGVRRVADLGYRDELQAIAQADATVHYIPIVSREPGLADWAGLRGHVHDVLEKEEYHRLVGDSLDPEQCRVFLCGNPDMIQSVRPLLERRGFRTHSKRSPGNIHLERYW